MPNFVTPPLHRFLRSCFTSYMYVIKFVYNNYFTNDIKSYSFRYTIFFQALPSMLKLLERCFVLMWTIHVTCSVLTMVSAVEDMPIWWSSIVLPRSIIIHLARLSFLYCTTSCQLSLLFFFSFFYTHT